MVQPLVAAFIDIVLRAERTLIEILLGALVDDGSLVARKRRAVLVRLEKVLAHLGTDILEDETQVRGDRIVAQNGVLGL